MALILLLFCLPILLVQLQLKTVNHISLRKAKIVCNFGLSECNRVKDLCQYQYVFAYFQQIITSLLGKGWGRGWGGTYTLHVSEIVRPLN